ncbi:MAG TPA: hypothetical protein DD670_16090 [Planctomycetaceae bacterium]|nr:hypothetical protein [Planctomycetaceae bacterium]
MAETGSILKLGILVAAVVSAVAAACAGAPWLESFEGPTPSWTFADSDMPEPLRRHERVGNMAFAGRQSEYFQVVGQGGTSVFVSHDVGRPAIISELAAAVWVKADRPGIRIFARVVLPRTLDPRTQTPVLLRLEGTSYTHVGRWQLLQIGNLPELLKQRIRGLRLQLGPQVDGLEAYVDQIHLNLYGGPGTTRVWVDELSLVGYADSRPASSSAVPLDSLPDPRSAGNGASSPTARGTAAGAAPTTSSVPGFEVSPVQPALGGASVDRSPRFQHDGSIEVNDRRILPRAIRYQGESLARLKELGFNTIWIAHPAPAAMLAEAARLDLYVICPPPETIRTSPADDPLAPVAKIGPEYDPVLAWDLGSDLSEQHVAPLQELAKRLRAADDGRKRPLICRPDSNLREFSNFVDVLLVGQSPLATSLELYDYAKWIRHRSLLARSGTAIWSTVQTEPSPALLDQWSVGGSRWSLPPSVNVEQMRLMAYMAVASGSRGLLFESSHSLDAADPETRARAASVELVNLELELTRPWVSSGTLLGTARCSQPDLLGAVFEYRFTRLLVPLWVGPGAQYVPGQSAAHEMKFIASGVPDTNQAYEIVPGGLMRHERNRVSGGIEVTLGEFSLCSLVLFAEDPEIVKEVTRQARAVGPRMSRLYRQLASRKMEIVEDVDRRLANRVGQWNTSDHLTSARKYLQSSDGAFAAKNDRDACLNADRAMRLLRLVERSNWEKAVRPLSSPIASPATVCFATIPWHWSLADQTRSWRAGPNLIGGGDFESVASVMAARWGHFKHAAPNVASDGAIEAKAARSGVAGLCLVNRPDTPDNSPTLVETAPVWVTSPAAMVEAGSLVRIQGWVHIPKPLTGSVDGLKIFDSAVGEALAERVGETTGWQPFTLYRFAPRSGPMAVTFALCGLGEAWVDDVAIQVLAPPTGAAMQPFAGPAARPGVGPLMRPTTGLTPPPGVGAGVQPPVGPARRY